MFNLHNLPPKERPRERLIQYGVEVLSLQELLVLIFGRGTKGESVMTISQKLLSRFGSLENLSETSIEDLQTIKGLGIAKACQIKACFEIARRLNASPHYTRENKKGTKSFVGPQDIFYQVRPMIVNYHKEHLLVVSLDNRNKIISIDIVSIGTLNSNLIHPRETFEVAIKHHAAQIILCHNHPSGELTPSKEDIMVTKKLVSAGKLLDIKVIDHLIISKDRFFSFRQEGRLI